MYITPYISPYKKPPIWGASLPPPHPLIPQHRRYEREVQRQHERDEAHITTSQKWVHKQHVAKEDSALRCRTRKKRKEERTRTTEDKAAGERARQQERCEMKVERILAGVQDATGRRQGHLLDAARKAHTSDHTAQVLTSRAHDFDCSCTLVETLSDKHHCFPQRRLLPSCYPPLNTSSCVMSAASPSPLTPKPPPSLPNTTSANPPGRGVLTKNAVKAAEEWIKFRQDTE